MPQRLNVVRLNEGEKESLTKAVSSQQADHVSRAVKASLKDTAAAVVAAAKQDLDYDSLRAAEQALNSRLRLLGALPVAPAVEEAVAESNAALTIVTEALGMLSG